MTAESSAWDRLVMPRDTPSILGPEIPGAASCPNCHRLADLTGVMRRYIDRIEADLAAANLRLAAIQARNERTAP